MTVLICGLGTVGKPLKALLSLNHEVLEYDIPKGLDSGRYDRAECVFISVPCDTLPSRRQDLSIIQEVVEKFKGLNVPLFIKSTVLPGTCDSLSNKYGAKVVAFPEFLTARNAYEDIKKQDLIAGTHGDSESEQMLKHLFPGKILYSVSNSEAEMNKYIHNYRAFRDVVFHNRFKYACDKLGINFERCKHSYNITNFFGHSHAMVPGPDGLLGAGGTCLPKDSKALISLFQDLAVPVAEMKNLEIENSFYRENKEIDLG